MIIEKIKKAIKADCEGKVMVRKNRSYRGLEQQGIQAFDVYFDTPTPSEKAAIYTILEMYDVRPGRMRTICGAYGFVISFQVNMDAL